MQKHSLQMYLGGQLIDEVHLNYNGLHSEEEREWYYQGAITDLRERHEALLNSIGLEPTFLLGVN